MPLATRDQTIQEPAFQPSSPIWDAQSESADARRVELARLMAVIRAPWASAETQGAGTL